MTRGILWCLMMVSLAAPCRAEDVIEADLLIAGGDESGCAAAVQAARLGVRRIVLVNDVAWLGGQFCTQGIGPVDEWTLVNERRVSFPRSGPFSEIIDRIRAHNRLVYGVANPGNSWCGSETIEPKAAAQIFEDWLKPYVEKGSGQIRVLKGWRPVKVVVTEGRVTEVEFEGMEDEEKRLRVRAPLTIDSTDWGDVIRLSGAGYMAGPDLKSRFGEPSAPEVLEKNGHQEMNPISWCPLLRDAGKDSTIVKPLRYDERSFDDWKSAPPWRDWDGSGGLYHPSGWCIYTHRRMVDRRHFNLAQGTEAVILNWPGHDYPLSTLPMHVVEALEKDEAGASTKNIVDMSWRQRKIVFADAKQRALEFVHFLQTYVHDRAGDFPESFRYMKLAEDYGTVDRLPPKPYIREGLRLEALYVLREQDVRTEARKPLWAKAMVQDGVFGYQFEIDFHPTRRKFLNDDPGQSWQGKHVGARNWSAHTDRAMFPLRGLVPVEMNGLLGASKNIGVTSLVQASLRLHGQMMHVGTAAGTVAAMALRDGIEVREIACSLERIREVQRILVRGAGGPGTLIWPWHDVGPEDAWFEAANMLTVLGVWRADADSLFFAPEKVVTQKELAGALGRLARVVKEGPEWPGGKVEEEALRSDEPATQRLLGEWLVASGLGEFASLDAKFAKGRDGELLLVRRDVVDYLYRVLQKRGEGFVNEGGWLEPGREKDGDGDGKMDLDDALPLDRDNDGVPDELEVVR